MAFEVLDNGDTMLTQRNKINDNFAGINEALPSFAIKYKLIASYKKAGVYTWIKPEMLTKVYVIILGAGGGGAVYQAPHDAFYAGHSRVASGGGSGFVRHLRGYDISSKASCPVVVGAGGNRRSISVAENIAGSMGGLSAFDGYVGLGGLGGATLGGQSPTVLMRGADGATARPSMSINYTLVENLEHPGSSHASFQKIGYDFFYAVGAGLDAFNLYEEAALGMGSPGGTNHVTGGGTSSSPTTTITTTAPVEFDYGTGGMPSGSGDSASDATGNGNGGGGASWGWQPGYGSAKNLTSGAGSDGMVLIYALANEAKHVEPITVE